MLGLEKTPHVVTLTRFFIFWTLLLFVSTRASSQNVTYTATLSGVGGSSPIGSVALSGSFTYTNQFVNGVPSPSSQIVSMNITFTDPFGGSYLATTSNYGFSSSIGQGVAYFTGSAPTGFAFDLGYGIYIQPQNGLGLTTPGTWPLNPGIGLQGGFLQGSDFSLGILGYPNGYFGLSGSIIVSSSYTPTLTISEIDTPTSTNGLHTFISTDTITLKAKTAPFTDVKWTVTGEQAAAGINGFPMQKVQTSDALGISTFSFSPAANDLFIFNRRVFWTGGDVVPNKAIQFAISATVMINNTTVTDSLAQHADLNPLVQDETDILRQEYVDYGFAAIPFRGDFVPSESSGNVQFNTGNYSMQLDYGTQMQSKYNTILAAYRGKTIMVNNIPFVIPNDAKILVSSGYRNPQRNLAVGSLYAQTSKHTLGRALDLVPAPIFTVIGGKKVNIDHTHLNQPLLDAAKTVGTALVEEGNNPKVTVSAANHIHIQW